jgi:hypothetical protein
MFTPMGKLSRSSSGFCLLSPHLQVSTSLRPPKKIPELWLKRQRVDSHERRAASLAPAARSFGVSSCVPRAVPGTSKQPAGRKTCSQGNASVPPSLGLPKPSARHARKPAGYTRQTSLLGEFLAGLGAPWAPRPVLRPAWCHAAARGQLCPARASQGPDTRTFRGHASRAHWEGRSPTHFRRGFCPLYQFERDGEQVLVREQGGGTGTREMRNAWVSVLSR